MVSPEPMIQIVTELLTRFEQDGYRQVILISGHYPNRVEYLDAAREQYLAGGGAMKVLALVENQIPDGGGDHAAKYETSFMMYLHPDTVDRASLRRDPQDDIGGPEEKINWMGEEYRGHPCYGLVGVDPRAHASAGVGEKSTRRLIDFLERWLDERE